MQSTAEKIARRFTLAALLLISSLAAYRASAQVATGTILGQVHDSGGAIVPGASISIVNLATNIATPAVTNSSGLFTVPNLQPGHYKVSATATGFSSQTAPNVTLDIGEQQVVDFVMKVGKVSQNIIVTSAAPTVDLASSTVQPVVNEHTIVELPLNGRDWTQLANLQPGVAAVRTQSPVAVTNQRANRGVGNQETIDGARPQMNNYRVDGISINDYSNGGPGGVNGGNLGVDAIQEFSVVTSNATADYGKTAGGVINAVTRTGGNRVHGDVYEFLRNSALDARNEFDQPGHIAPFRRNQFGASLGGPILKDRTFIFGDYEGLRQYQSLNIGSVVPSAAAREGHLASGNIAVDPAVQKYLPFYPLPNGTVSGDTGTFLFNDPTVTGENYFTIRADDQISPTDHMAGTYFFDSGNITSPDPFNVRVTGNIDKRQMATVSESHTFTANLLNTARFGYSRVISRAPITLNAINPLAGDTSLGFVPGLPSGIINVGGLANFQGGLNAVGEYDFHLNSYQIYDDLYWTHGRHSIKAGFAFERLQNNQVGQFNPNGQYNFNSLSDFLTNKPLSFTAPIGQSTTPKDLRQSVYGAYIMDDFHMLQNLTLNLGLRYEPATVPTETAGRLSNLPTLTATAPNLGSPYFSNPTLKNFAPRIGFSWGPDKNGKTAIHGAYGIYDALPLNYLFEGLTILSAPFYESGTVSNLPAGDFPTEAYGLLTPATFRYAYTPQKPARSYVQQWNLNIQQQFPGEFTVQIGYFGSHGVHLPYREDDINTVLPSSINNGVYEFPSLINNTPGNTPNPKLNNALGQISAMIPIGYSEYNALQAQVTRRLINRLQLQASYTWAKSIDDGSSSTFGDTFFNSVSSLPYFAPRRRRAVSDFDIAQNLVFNYLYLLPDAPSSFGRAGWLLDGWQYGGIVQLSTGLPFTPLISGDPMGLRSADPFGFPNRSTGPGCQGNAVNPQNKTHYIKTQCFSYPTETANFNPFLGTSGRNSLFGPGLEDFDMSFVKNNSVKKFGDTFNVQFRAELFNIFNRVNYSTPLKASTFLFAPPAAPTKVNGVYTGALNGTPIASAGALTSTASSSRQTQFALKIVF